MSEVKILSVEDILAAPDVIEEIVDVPSWGGAVKIKSFTKGEQMNLRRQAMARNGQINTDKLEMLLFVNGIVEPKFTPEHYDKLLEKSAGAVDTVLKRIMAISGLSDSEVAQAEATFQEES